MPKIILRTREGEELELKGSVGQSVMETIRDNGISELQAMCGGCCSCATCHIYIDLAFADNIPPMSEDEDDLLSSSEYRNEHSRLSCQVVLSAALDGLRAEIAPES
jgi:ferredoxin, 2Fe-2S